jgi:hypothetical protein
MEGLSCPVFCIADECCSSGGGGTSPLWVIFSAIIQILARLLKLALDGAVIWKSLSLAFSAPQWPELQWGALDWLSPVANLVESFLSKLKTGCPAETLGVTSFVFTGFSWLLMVLTYGHVIELLRPSLMKAAGDFKGSVEGYIDTICGSAIYGLQFVFLAISQNIQSYFSHRHMNEMEFKQYTSHCGPWDCSLLGKPMIAVCLFLVMPSIFAFFTLFPMGSTVLPKGARGPDLLLFGFCKMCISVCCMCFGIWDFTTSEHEPGVSIPLNDMFGVNKTAKKAAKISGEAEVKALRSVIQTHTGIRAAAIAAIPGCMPLAKLMQYSAETRGLYRVLCDDQQDCCDKFVDFVDWLSGVFELGGITAISLGVGGESVAVLLVIEVVLKKIIKTYDMLNNLDNQAAEVRKEVEMKSVGKAAVQNPMTR